MMLHAKAQLGSEGGCLRHGFQEFSDTNNEYGVSEYRPPERNFPKGQFWVI